jgi:hypothetical protein
MAHLSSVLKRRAELSLPQGHRHQIAQRFPFPRPCVLVADLDDAVEMGGTNRELVLREPRLSVLKCVGEMGGTESTFGLGSKVCWWIKRAWFDKNTKCVQGVGR